MEYLENCNEAAPYCFIETTIGGQTGIGISPSMIVDSQKKNLSTALLFYTFITNPNTAVLDKSGYVLYTGQLSSKIYEHTPTNIITAAMYIIHISEGGLQQCLDEGITLTFCITTGKVRGIPGTLLPQRVQMMTLQPFVYIHFLFQP